MRQLPRGANLQSVKWQNRAVVLETLWRYQPLSRKDLAQRTRLTAATLTNIVSELIDAGIVQEVGLGEQKLGRRPMMLTYIADRYYLIGVNLSRTDLSIALFDIMLHAQYRLECPITTRIGGGAAETLIHLIRQAITESGVDPGRIVAIGISSPGPLSVEEGVIYAPPSFSEWSNLPLGKLTEQAFNLPVWLENDANANALAEHWLGAGRSFNNFIYVENHSGVGSGIILEGRLFTGSAGVASELGHTSIDRHGPRCPCGNYGCVELYCSGPAVVENVRQRHASGDATVLAETAGGDLCGLTVDQVILAALHGDQLAIEVVQEASRALALGLVNAINLIDPEAVIIGHKFSRLGEICLGPVREIIQQQAWPRVAARMNILASGIPEPVAVTGAACRVLSALLQDPSLLMRNVSNG
ncbi:MAG TPA: ROK family transcriptional regulator [Aggregatilineaceae bacterium]|nr:ROK family transcriptional regulator [Aggregatilineaceae bacterium]